MKRKILISLIGFITNITFGQIDTTGQLYIDQSYSNIEMISDFFDGICVELTNISFTGSENNAAFFDAGNTDLGLNFGIVLSTGNVNSIPLPTSDFANSSMGLDGDEDLNNYTGPYIGYDAVVLEFDFVALSTDTIFFEYVFASEEYPEYVTSSFIDIFAFFVTDANGTELINRALTPGTYQPVLINTVNEFENSDLYVPYYDQGGNYHVFDGTTVPLPAVFPVEEGASYSVKIAISDVSDSFFDSGVFIGVGSLCSDDLLEPIADFDVVLQDSFNVTVTNNSLYSTSMMVVFGDGTSVTTSEKEITHSYQTSGDYFVETIALNSCCSSNQLDEVVIEDPVNVTNLTKSTLAFGPNPVQDKLQVDFPTGNPVSVLIYDLHGRIIYDRQIFESGVLDLRDVKDGLYTLVLKSDLQILTSQLVKK